MGTCDFDVPFWTIESSIRVKIRRYFVIVFRLGNISTLENNVGTSAYRYFKAYCEGGIARNIFKFY